MHRVNPSWVTLLPKEAILGTSMTSCLLEGHSCIITLDQVLLVAPCRYIVRLDTRLVLLLLEAVLSQVELFHFFSSFLVGSCCRGICDYIILLESVALVHSVIAGKAA